MARYFPLIALALGLLYLGNSLRAPQVGDDFDLDAFGRMTVLKHGRVKPLDTVARTTLLQLQGRQTVRTPDGERLQPVEWLVRLLYQPGLTDTYRTFEINHPEVRSLMGIGESQVRITYDRPAARFLAFVGFLPKAHKRFTFAQLEPQVAALESQVRLAQDIPAQQRSKFQAAAVQLYVNITLYQRIKYSLQDPSVPDFLDTLLAFQANLVPGTAAVMAREAGQPHDEAAAAAMMDHGRRFQFMAEFGNLLVIPPPSSAPDPLEWKLMGDALIDTFRTGSVDPYALLWSGIGRNWREGDAAKFNEGVGIHRSLLKGRYADALRKSDIETRFNAAGPFYTSMVLHVVAFLLVCAAWLRAGAPAITAARHLTALAFVASTAGILVRMWLEGRPPVTNLYSSAVFVGWGSVLLCLILEYFYRNGIGSAAAGIIGFSTLLVAHHLSLSGDTLEMMRAVLDSNFWLATHVIVITIGYSAVFVAGAIAILYVILGAFTRQLTPDLARNLVGMVYGVVCFATLFSLVGTILGGIWADQSWGRFWGWDPKENGALMIVLWNAVILHCRWGGLVGHLGFMNLAIVGNVITAWSWFGTNLLGVGLHSYGFTDSGAIALWFFVATQVLIIAIGLVFLRRYPVLRVKA